MEEKRNPCYELAEYSLEAGEETLLDSTFSILLATSGRAVISSPVGKHVLTQGDLCLLTPAMGSSLCCTGEHCSVKHLQLMPAYFDSLSESQLFYHQLSRFIADRTLPLLHLQPEDFTPLEQTIASFSGLSRFHTYRKGITHHLSSYLLLQITDLLCRQSFPIKTATYIKHTDELFRNFKKLLVEHYREQHKIRFYADQLHISTTYLSRIVKAATGRTVRFHLSGLLCADARKLLESSDMNIKGIAGLLGFSNQSVFEKFFSTHTGISPLKYRLKKEYR